MEIFNDITKTIANVIIEIRLWTVKIIVSVFWAQHLSKSLLWNDGGNLNLMIHYEFYNRWNGMYQYLGLWARTVCKMNDHILCIVSVCYFAKNNLYKTFQEKILHSLGRDTDVLCVRSHIKQLVVIRFIFYIIKFVMELNLYVLSVIASCVFYIFRLLIANQKSFIETIFFLWRIIFRCY